MFKKILIANRGEIACRVMKTAKRMGIATVAVYSDAERDALHVRMADEAVRIGPAASRDSYLNIDAVVAAIKQTGADAVHPGYGFLSENAAFAEALSKIGVAFIGPPVAAIAAMGDKIESKKLAAKAKVNTVPGNNDLIQDADHAARISKDIGYPVMIKASAGGGGKGMRVAFDESQAREGFVLAQSEARSSFGDDRIFIEKFIEQPRHIEIQVIGDQHGKILYLGERECSIQRRNQKVIEEAPSPFLDEKTRKAMGEQAVALAKAVGYFSAGTVEFIADKKRNFYFLEMNTRLQVEHPVTELVTGLDLVELMIRVAAGEKLTLLQKDVKLNGWAIESRLYAEDPYRNFLPSVGRLTRYRPPTEESRDVAVRNDTGVLEGGEISIHYDPMIAKLCTWGKDRKSAIDAMASALDVFEVEGVGHNLPFVSCVMDMKRFRNGNLSTAFIAEEFPNGFSGIVPDDDAFNQLAVIAAFIHLKRTVRGAELKGTMENHKRIISEDWVVSSNGRSAPIKATRENDVMSISVAGQKPQFVESAWRPGATLGTFRIGANDVAAKTNLVGSAIRLRRRGMDVTLNVRSPRVTELSKLMPKKLPKDMSRFLLCPMPGVVRSVSVVAGDMVEAGQALAVVEAMKMENVLRAEKSAKVKRVAAAAGSSLAVDELILEFE